MDERERRDDSRAAERGTFRDAEHGHAKSEADVRPDASPEWRELFRSVRRAVERMRE